MALTIDLSISIDSDRLNGTLTDGTVYGTGGNPARADVRVFCTGYKMSYANTGTALTVTGNDADPETDTSWRFNIPEDGYFKFLFVIIEDEYDVGDTYAQYDAVYNGNLVYRSKVAGNVGNSLTNTNFWEAIADPSSLAENKDQANESLNITSLVYRRVLSPNSQYTFANDVSNQCACTDCDESVTLQQYSAFARDIDAMSIADDRSDVLRGEFIARRVQSRYIDCQ